MEKTDDIHYNIDDKKIYNKYKNFKTNDNNKKNSNDKYNNDYNSKEKPLGSATKKAINLIDERTVDLFVIDGDDDIVVSTKYKKKINRKRNKFKEIIIEKYDSSTPVRNDKLTGFVLIRKNRGKKVFDIELEDDIEKANNVLNKKDVRIKGETIQIITLTKLMNFQTDIDNYENKILSLQNKLDEKEYEQEEDNNKNKDKDKEKDNQISNLKSKNEELKNSIKKQEQQINNFEKEMKQLKLAYDQLKESYQNLEKENKTLTEQVHAQAQAQTLAQAQPSTKLKKKVAQMQLAENNDQKNIKEMKERIKKYKDELKKVPTIDARHRLSLNRFDEENSKRSHKGSIHISQRQPQPKDNKDEENKKEEDDEDFDEDYDMGEDGGDPKKKK